VTLNAGAYDYYLEKRAARPVAVAWSAATSPEPKAAPARKAEKARKLSYKETRELETIEDDILAAEEKAGQLETTMTASDFYVQHGSDWKRFETELEAAKAEVTRLYARWEELAKIRDGA
jgi:ATP-binding cassette subfamily F protein uup